MTNNTKVHYKHLGLWTLTALVAGNMVGSGIFLLPASLANYGSISIYSWIFTSMGALLIALVFAKLSAINPRIGGPYAYCREAYGGFIGFQMAYNYWIALWVGNAAIAVAFAGYLGFFFPILHASPKLSFLVSAGAIWLMTFVNIVGVRHVGILQLITTVLKFLPLLLIASLGLLFIQPHNLQGFNFSGHSNLFAFTSAATLTLWAFIGLEAATVPAEHVDDPQRNIPRATIFGVIITAIIYILSSIAIMGVIPAEQLKHSTAPYADAAQIMFGPMGSIIVALGAVISCFGALNGWTLLQGQVPMAAARDRLFPKIFAKESRFFTPAIGLIITAVLITLLLMLTLDVDLVKQFTFIILLATLSSLVLYLYTVVALLVIYAKDKERFPIKKIIFPSILAILATIYSFWTIIGSGKEVVFYGVLLFFSSVPVYAWMRFRARQHESVI